VKNLRYDLNLLRVFRALHRHRNTTRAGEALGLTQSAVSNALGRLRLVMDDPLFVRVGNEMRPTAYAREIAPRVDAILKLASEVLEPPAFAAATSDRTFTIALGEYQCITLFPRLVAAVRRKAPGVRLVATEFPNPPRQPGELLEEHMDFGLTAGTALASHYRSEQLGDDRFVVLMRSGHELENATLDIDAYCAAHHLAETPYVAHGRSLIDESLEAMGRRRNIAASTNYFASCPRILEDTDLVLTTSSRLARLHSESHRLVTRPLPWALSASPLILAWDESNHRSPAHQWLRGVIVAVSRLDPDTAAPADSVER